MYYNLRILFVSHQINMCMPYKLGIHVFALGMIKNISRVTCSLRNRHCSVYINKWNEIVSHSVLIYVNDINHLLITWIMNDPNTTTQPQPPSGGTGTFWSSSSSVSFNALLMFLRAGGPWAILPGVVGF